MGSKFIPSFYYDNFSIIKDEFLKVDEEIQNFNTQLFIKDSQLNRMNDLSNIGYYEENDIFDQLKRDIRKNKFKAPNLSEGLSFEIEFLKNLESLEFRINNNISENQYRSILWFQKNKPFKVVELDKNVGSAIISNELFESLTNDLLNDTFTYEEIDFDPTLRIKNEINDKLLNLCSEGLISNRLFKLLEVGNDCKLGSIRILPKIHKKKFGVRPTINYRNHPTSSLCALIDKLLKPFVVTSASYLKDSQHLMQEVENKRFPLDSTLISGDFEALYTNLEHDLVLDYISNFMKDRLSDFKDLKIEGFKAILEMILKYNYFTFRDKFYLQIKGIAMGSKTGPSIANIFVHIVESIWLEENKPLFYKRFIDDIFVILEKEGLLIKIDSLKRAFGSLKLNLVIDKSVDFLDLNINLDNVTGYLNFKVFFKSTKTFSYLLTSSNHPVFVFKNIPKSLFLRIRRICTKTEDYIYFSIILTKYLVLRGYNLKFINRIFSMVLNLDRIDILKYKQRNKTSDYDTIFYCNKYNKGIYNINEIVKKSFSDFLDKYERFKMLKIRVVNKMNFNLAALFIHDFKYKKIYKNCFRKCDNILCSTCFYFNQDYFIDLNNNYLLPILDNSCCNSFFCIYIIKCLYCKSFYIGQTNDISKRVYDHVNDIKTFKMYTYKADKCVAVHFNLKNHNYVRDFSIYIMKKDITPLRRRLMYESFLLNLFDKLKISVFNEFKLPPLIAYNENILLDTIE